MSATERLSDEQIAARARDGDEVAAARLFDRYMPLLRWRVRHRLPARLRRKVGESDVIQEAYLGAVRRLAEFEDRGEGSFNAWLGTIVDRRVADQVRRYLDADKRNANREITKDGNDVHPVHPSEDPSVSTRARRLEAMDNVQRALSRLSQLDRTVVELVHFQGQSIASAAELMGSTRNATRMRYGRALVRLRRFLGPTDGEVDREA